MRERVDMKTEPEVYPPEALGDDEPRYLRRQKPLEVRRRRFTRRSWNGYRRRITAALVLIAAGCAGYAGVHFLLFSPRVRLAGTDDIEIMGNRYVSRELVVEKFAGDIGKSVMRVPLDARRTALEAIPWIEKATVQRVLPARIRV